MKSNKLLSIHPCGWMLIHKTFPFFFIDPSTRQNFDKHPISDPAPDGHPTSDSPFNLSLNSSGPNSQSTPQIYSNSFSPLSSSPQTSNIQPNDLKWNNSNSSLLLHTKQTSILNSLSSSSDATTSMTLNSNRTNYNSNFFTIAVDFLLYGV